MSKEIIYSDKAREKILRGVKKISGAVKLTAGPKGKNTVLDRKYTTPLVTNDGVTIAKEITLSDPFENVGASIIKEACIKTNDIAGDGTTTAIILSEKIITEGIRNIVAGANPIILKRGIDKATKIVIDELDNMSRPVNGRKEIEEIATISAGNKQIGVLIADAFEKVGNDGIITIQEGNLAHTYISYVEGMQIERGYISPYMITNPEKMIAELNDPYIFITEDKLTSIQDIIHILEICAKEGRKLFIISDDIDGEALAALNLNIMRGTISAAAIRCPSFGDKRRNILNDIAILVGAKVFKKGVHEISAIKEFLGFAKKIDITKSLTTIIDGNGNHDEIDKHIKMLHNQKQIIEDEIEKSDIEDRLAKLCGKVAVINVGAPSEVEMKETKLRIEDALSATRSAKEEGVVPGGGVALLSCKFKLFELINNLSGDEQTGAKIISKAIESPIRQIASNSGEDESIVVHKIVQKNTPYYGFDALNLDYCNMFERGIIDPTKVTKTAIMSAASVASTLLTTECIVIEKEEKETN